MKLDHIAIVVEDIEETIEWYQANFDARVNYVDETWASIRVGDTNISFVLKGMHPTHIAFDYTGTPCNSDKKHRDGSRYEYLTDPSGNVIEKIWWE